MRTPQIVKKGIVTGVTNYGRSGTVAVAGA
jgi:hypothetical protein